MGFIADPNAGPTPKMAEAGVMLDFAQAYGANIPVTSVTVTGEPGTATIVFSRAHNLLTGLYKLSSVGTFLDSADDPESVTAALVTVVNNTTVTVPWTAVEGAFTQVGSMSVLYASGAVILSKSLISRPLSTAFEVNIRSSADGSYTIRGIDLSDKIYTIQGATAYTSSSGTVNVNFARFIREAYVEFTPSADATDIYVEGFSYGRGA